MAYGSSQDGSDSYARTAATFAPSMSPDALLILASAMERRRTSCDLSDLARSSSAALNSPFSSRISDALMDGVQSTARLLDTSSLRTSAVALPSSARRSIRDTRRPGSTVPWYVEMLSRAVWEPPFVAA